MEAEVAPGLPTSGQVLGVLVKTMGFQQWPLRGRTARRLYSGRLEGQVKDLSRREALDAIAAALGKLGLAVSPAAVAAALEAHAQGWDRLRAFLLPRMPRVYPKHLPDLWRAYLRLACIDLALRVGALLRHTGAGEDALDFLASAQVAHRGEHLNRLRNEAGVSLLRFPDAAGAARSTAQGWLYKGARPSDAHLREIALALAPRDAPHGSVRILRELRLLYWVSDVARVLEAHVGGEAATELLDRLRRYALATCRLAGAPTGPNSHLDLLFRGASSRRAPALVAALSTMEEDAAWRSDLLATAGDWVGRVLEANLLLHQEEVEELVQRTGGRVLERWDVRNPRAYEHYQRSVRLQAQGMVHEALAEVARAVELDPLDPVNHFTLGSGLGGIGNATGDEALIRRGLEACWRAHALDPMWSSPWTEIGLLHSYLGEAGEAVAHLEGIAPGCGPVDARYHAALGLAKALAGEHRASLEAYEASLVLNPNDPSVTVGAAMAASLADDKLAFNRHAKAARFLGAGDELDRSLRFEEAMATLARAAGIRFAAGQREAAAGHMTRAKDHFLRGEDHRAVAELDAAVARGAGNAAVFMLRGVVHGYNGRHERAVADLSEVIRLCPDIAQAHLCRGQSLGELDALELAIDDFDTALRLDPTLVQALQARGECRMYLGEADAAIADFDAALALDPEGARSHRGRGAAHRMRGELELAVADLDTALRLDPEDAYAHRFRGFAHLEGADGARALADFDACLRRLPGDPAALRGRGSAHLLVGRPDLALADFDAAVAANPESGLAHHERGLAREALGDRDGAASDYRRARELGYDDA